MAHFEGGFKRKIYSTECPHKKNRKSPNKQPNDTPQRPRKTGTV